MRSLSSQVNEKPLDSEEAARSQMLRKEKNEHKKYVYSHGITPPFKNVRKKRFRKTAPKKIIDDPEVEKEVKSENYDNNVAVIRDATLSSNVIALTDRRKFLFLAVLFNAIC